MHTPGPWKAYDNTIFAGDVDRGSWVAECYQCDADANLIAAAPDLLEMLERWQQFAHANGWTDADHHDANGFGWVSATDAVIRAAKGESDIWRDSK